MAKRRGALIDWLAAAVIGALVFAWFGHAFLNYDTFYALVWGSDLVHGRTPDYTVPVAPTPHPLAQLVGIVLAPVGAWGRSSSASGPGCWPRRSSSRGSRS